MGVRLWLFPKAVGSTITKFSPTWAQGGWVKSIAHGTASFSAKRR